MCEAEQEMWEEIVDNDPDRHLDDRTADEQLADRAGEARERFSVEGLRELEEWADSHLIVIDVPLEADDYPNGVFCHRLPECRGRSSCPRDIACTH